MNITGDESNLLKKLINWLLSLDIAGNLPKKIKHIKKPRKFVAFIFKNCTFV